MAATTPPSGGADTLAPLPSPTEQIATIAETTAIGPAATFQPVDDPSIRPFQFHASDAPTSRSSGGASTRPDGLNGKRSRTSQGVQLAFIQALARYWATDYDWRKVRGATERASPIHHRDRRVGHPLHSRPVET